MTRHQGREHEPQITALTAPSGARIEVRSPAVGLWRDAPPAGNLVRPGDAIGRMEVLGVMHRLIAPAQAQGIVSMSDHQGERARRPLQHGQIMLVLDPEAALAGMAADTAAGAGAGAAEQGRVFRAPTSGRFYGRPAPDRPPFVQPGDEITVGQTVCLIEVMKTFIRVAYGGAGLPERARVGAVKPTDDAELAAGDVILILE
jgi:acetyl-CoA carboxylase biotin carboxyl carrier protein